MKKLIIFGVGEQAELANYYFSHGEEYSVEAFSVNEEFIENTTFCNKAVIPFENIEKQFDPKDYSFFVAIGYNKINQLRTDKYHEVKKKGYKVASYISSKASIFTDSFGENNFILEDNTIQPFVKIGNNVTIWSGNHIGHHSVIEDNCFITSHVVISGGCKIGEGSFVGVNATLRDHISIGKKNVIGAGAIILGDTGDEEVYPANRTEKIAIPSSKLRRI